MWSKSWSNWNVFLIFRKDLMKQEVNFIVRGYLHLMKLQWMPLMTAQKLSKLIHINPDQGLDESTMCYLNVLKTCLIKQSHRLSHAQFLLVYPYLIAETFKTMNGTSLVKSVSSLLLRALQGLVIHCSPMPQLHRRRAFVETASLGLTWTTLTIWQAHNLLRPSWGLTVPRSKDQNQGKRRGSHWMKFWQQEIASAVLECSGLLP